MSRTSSILSLIALSLLSLSAVAGCGDTTSEPCLVDCEGDGDPDFGGFSVAPPPRPNDPGNEKDSFEAKMAALVEAAEVPSTLAGAFLQQSRAYLSGREPITQLEVSAFAILDTVSPETLNAIARTLDRIDEMPAEDMEKVYGAQFINASANEPLTHSILASAMSGEIRARTMIAEFGSSYADLIVEDEDPGLPRSGYCSDIDGGYAGACPNVCSIRTSAVTRPIRTNGFVPYLAAGEYDVSEVEQDCTIDPENGNVDCTTVTQNCKGTFGGNTGNTVCLAVPLAQAGETVTLFGYNFHDVNATVQLVGKPPSLFVRKVNAHVWGDLTTPANAPVDCQIGDRLSFRIPEDMPVGVYRVGVEVSDLSDPRRSLHSFGSPFIEVVPPQTATFSFSTEEFTCLDPTDGEWGSDEIGLKVITVPVLPNGDLGEMQEVEFEFGDVDRGERRRMDRVHFSGSVSNGFGFTVIGYEIDNREAYKQSVTEFSEAFILITKSNWGKISTTLGSVVGGVVGAFGGPALGTAVGAAVALAMNAIVGTWAPADLVIQDSGGVSFLQMAELTSLNVASPARETNITERGVEVIVEPCEDTADKDHPGCDQSAKAPWQYRERRQYRTGLNKVCPSQFPCNPDNLGSKYQLTFRYNRLN